MHGIINNLSNIFKEGELDENSTCANFAQVADNGKTYNYKLYSLAAIIAVGYRINSERAMQFRTWATRQARRHIPMTMEDWKTKLDAFLRFNDADVLQDKGKVTAAIAKEFAESEFEKYRVIQDSLYESDFDKLMNDMEKNDAIN